MRIRLIVPGFGAPNVKEKQRILKANLDRILQSMPEDAQLDVHVHIYDDSYTHLMMPDGRYRLFEWRCPGIVGDFIVKHSCDPTIHECEKVMILFDDVELMNDFDLAEAIRIQEEYFLDIFSPCLTDTSKTHYPYMKKNYIRGYDELLRITNVCELFCYLMPVNRFLMWCSHIDSSNPWLWGMDLLLYSKFNMQVGMYPGMSMHHHYQNTCYDMHPDIAVFERFHAYLAKYGETQATLASMPIIRTTINIKNLHH